MAGKETRFEDCQIVLCPLFLLLLFCLVGYEKQVTDMPESWSVKLIPFTSKYLIWSEKEEE